MTKIKDIYKDIVMVIKTSVKPFLYVLMGVVLVSVIIGGKTLLLDQRTRQEVKGLNNETLNLPTSSTTALPTVTPTPSPTPNPNPSVAPAVIYKNTLPLPTPIPTQTDSATHIELCKTKAETHKTQVMTALVLVYNQNNADAMKIANTSSVEELVNVGISIGLITTEQYNSDPSGHQLALLQTRTKVMAEIKSFMDTVNGKGSLAYNDYYVRCLSG